MKLLTAPLLKSLPQLYETDQQPETEKIVHVHYFLGSWDWYAVEFTADEDEHVLGTFFGLVDGAELELGYFCLAEMQEVRVAPFGLGVERDLHWQPRPLSEVRTEREAMRCPSH
jgi:hypothetical protein